MRAESERGARSMELHGCYRRLLLQLWQHAFKRENPHHINNSM